MARKVKRDKIMPLFSYVIRDKFKKVLKGTREAESEEDLKEYFRRQEYLVFAINKIDRANTSKENANPPEGFKIGKLLFILILVGGSYFIIKSINRFSYRFKKEGIPVKVETIPKETPVSKIPETTIGYEPEQDIAADKAVPEIELEQKEGVVKITLKREAEKIPTHLKASPNYIKAQTYYNTALRQKRIGSKEVNSYLRKAIKYAQYALQSKEGVEEEIRAFIRTCRKMLLMP